MIIAVLTFGESQLCNSRHIFYLIFVVCICDRNSRNDYVKIKNYSFKYYTTLFTILGELVMMRGPIYKVHQVSRVGPPIAQF